MITLSGRREYKITRAMLQPETTVTSHDIATVCACDHWFFETMPASSVVALFVINCFLLSKTPTRRPTGRGVSMG